MDSQENWSLRTQEGVLVIENDKIIQRTSKENLDEILRKYWILTAIHTQNDSFSLGLTSELRKWFIYRTLSFLCQVQFEKNNNVKYCHCQAQVQSRSIPGYFLVHSFYSPFHSKKFDSKTPPGPAPTKFKNPSCKVRGASLLLAHIGHWLSRNS